MDSKSKEINTILKTSRGVLQGCEILRIPLCIGTGRALIPRKCFVLLVLISVRG
jgi:hypothetical protein